jgi:hypothetical protein
MTGKFEPIGDERRCTRSDAASESRSGYADQGERKD